MRLPKFRCKNKVGNWYFFTVLHNGNVNEENFDLETLSEFTALLDKQGKEIYEGDIVLYDPTSGYSRKFVIEYDNEDASFKCLYHKKEDRDVITPYKINQRLVVIGNIYENLELLGTE